MQSKDNNEIQFEGGEVETSKPEATTEAAPKDADPKEPVSAEAQKEVTEDTDKLSAEKAEVPDKADKGEEKKEDAKSTEEAKKEETESPSKKRTLEEASGNDKPAEGEEAEKK